MRCVAGMIINDGIPMKFYKSRCKAEQSVILFVLLIYARGLLLVLLLQFYLYTLLKPLGTRALLWD